MSKPRLYQHLSPEDRAVIMIASRQNHSVRAIARILGRSASTISRELKRLGQDTTYDASAAAQHYRQQRLNSRRRPSGK